MLAVFTDWERAILEIVPAVAKVKLSGEVTVALATKNTLHYLVQIGILKINLQTSLLQEQLNLLWEAHGALFSLFHIELCYTR